MGRARYISFSFDDDNYVAQVQIGSTMTYYPVGITRIGRIDPVEANDRMLRALDREYGKQLKAGLIALGSQEGE